MLKKIYNFIEFRINKLGNNVKCNICNGSAFHYFRFKNGLEKKSDFLEKIDMVGSIEPFYQCAHCGSTNRERHLFFYFDKLNIWDKIAESEILFFAPEKNILSKIKSLNPKKLIQADILPKNNEMTKVDVTKIQYKENSFDIIFCNHVLEHVKEYEKALSEIYRVLKPNGIAILQTPFSKKLFDNFYDKNIIDEKDRFYFYGLWDHERVFSERVFLNSIKDAGFKLQIVKHSEILDKKTTKKFGVAENEDLIRVSK